MVYSSEDDETSTESSEYESTSTSERSSESESGKQVKSPDDGKQTKKSNKKDDSDSEEDTEDDEDDYDEEEPTTWKHAAILEEAVQLEKMLKGNMKKKKQQQQSGAKRHLVIDPLGDLGDITQYVDSAKGINPNVEGFMPSKYLATFHKLADEKKLANGKMKVEQGIKKQRENMKEFVRSNLARFVYCKDSVEEIFLSEDEFQGTWLRSIEINFRECHRKASTLFQPMIQTKQRGEDVKKAYNLLVKLQFVLSIPAQIEDAIEKENFRSIVTNYKKAKYYMSETSSPLFQSLFSIVKKQIVGVRERMFSILAEPFIAFEEKQRVIRHLYELEPEEDPALFYLRSYHSYIITRLEDCMVGKEEEDADLNPLLILKRSVALTPVPSEYPLSENFEATVEMSPYRRDEDPEKSEGKIKKLSETLKTHLPFFWKHSKSIIEGKYDRTNDVEIVDTKKSRKDIEQDIQQKKEQKQSKSDEIYRLFTAIFTTYANNASDLLNQIDNGSSHQPHYFSATNDIVNCNIFVRNLEVDPLYIDTLDDFSEQIRHVVINKISCLAVSEISSLHGEEDWIVSSSGTTRVQRMFEKRFHVLIKDLKQFVTPFDDFVDIKSYMRDALLAFADTLHQLAVSSCNFRKKTKKVEHKFHEENNHNSTVHPTTRLLFILSNCRYTMSHIDSLASSFVKEIMSIRSSTTTALKNEVKSPKVEKQPASPPKKLRNILKLTKKKPRPETDSDTESSESDDSSETETSDTETDETTESTESSDESDCSEDEPKVKSPPPPPSSKVKYSYTEEDYDVKKDAKIITEVYTSLETFIVDSYVRNKTRSLNTFVTKGILTGGHDWFRCPPPSEVRYYMLELLLDLAQVHYQAEIVARETIKRLFCKLHERLGELFTEYIRQIQRCGENGALQLELELEFLNVVLRHYETSRSKDLFKKLKANLRTISQDKGGNAKKLKEVVIQQMINKTRLQFSCFDLPDKI